MLPTEKLESLRARFSELEDQLCQPEVVNDSTRYVKLSRERGELQPLVEAYGRYLNIQKQIREDREALEDPELRDMALEELPGLEKDLVRIEDEISVLLLPTDRNDERDTVLEIRSGTGGEEASLFAADLFRMYSRYAEQKRWNVQILSMSESSTGGLKEVIALIKGERVYSVMRFEGGVHRVQRVPATEAQGRIHTSTATVAVMPEADEVDVQINDGDLEIQATGSGGPGGQHVNMTNSAIQMFHKPSGIMVRCQEERSQHKNRSRALQILRAKLLQLATDAHNAQQSAERRSMVGSGERSEKIRTYNYPQNRVTDHRIGMTLHKLEAIVEGDLEELVTALRNEHQASLLAEQSAR
ncbi:MAG TPA: peptide chain release factor 1 [Polyangiales bacterium]|nr:peptide chain release factor 1 [Polyangiales bacterium]